MLIDQNRKPTQRNWNGVWGILTLRLLKRCTYVSNSSFTKLSLCLICRYQIWSYHTSSHRQIMKTLYRMKCLRFVAETSIYIIITFWSQKSVRDFVALYYRCGKLDRTFFSMTDSHKDVPDMWGSTEQDVWTWKRPFWLRIIVYPPERASLTEISRNFVRTYQFQWSNRFNFFQNAAA